MQETSATAAGLCAGLTCLLSDPPRLRAALDNLSTSLLKNSEPVYVVDEEVARRIRHDLSAEQAVFLEKAGFTGYLPVYSLEIHRAEVCQTFQ